MGPDCPVCIPSAILCAKVLCVVTLWCFRCFRWRVQLGEVRWRYLTCPMRTATAWSPAGISVQWSGGYRSEDSDVDDGFWNPLLRSVNEWSLSQLLHSSPLWVGWSSGVSLHYSSNRLLSLSCNRCNPVLMCCSKALFQRRLSVSAFFWFGVWSSKACRNMFESYRVIVRKQSASGFDQQLQSVNTYANIKNMTSFQEHSKSSFVAKCLSSLHSMCKLDGWYTLGHFWRGRSFQEDILLSCDYHFLVRFSFLIPKNKFSHHLGCGKVWPNVANGTLTKIIYQQSTIKGVDMKKH